MSSPVLALSILIQGAALLLGLAGVTKLLRPATTAPSLVMVGLPSGRWAVRALGVLESAIAIAVIGVGGPVPAGALAVAHLCFAIFVIRLRSLDSSAPCGCFGRSTPVGTAHVVINFALAGAAAFAVAVPVSDLVTILRESPWRPVPAAVAVVVLAFILHRGLTSAPGSSDAAPSPREPRSVPAEIRGLDVGSGATEAVDLSGSGRTAVLVLSSTCLTCRGIWDELRRGPRPRLPTDVDLLIVTEGIGSEDQGAVAALAPTETTTLMVDDALKLLDVPGAPWALLVERGSTASTEGTGSDWRELHRLLFRRRSPGV